MGDRYGYIYKTTNTLNGKIYIGKHKAKNGKFDNRYYGSGIYLTNAIKKYGKENFVVDCLEWCSSLEELNDREKYWIRQCDSQNADIGYNISSGGDGASLCGSLNGMFGKRHTKETREKMSASHPKSYSEEFKQKISKSLMGHEVSTETREKIRATNLGHEPWNKNIKNPYSAETINKMSESAKKRGLSKEQHKKMIETIKSHKYHWYSSDINQESKKFREGEQPSGWTLGRRYYTCK